jgi:putative flippase GtrA
MYFISLPPSIIQFLTFLIIGVWNTAFDFGIWQVVSNLIKPDSKFNKKLQKLNLNRYSFAHVTAFVVANFVSYFLNRFFTFNSQHSTDQSFTVFKFFIVSLVSLSLTTFCLNYLTKSNNVLNFNKKYKFLEKYWPQVAKLIVVVLSMFLNFFGYKYLVF